MVDATLAAGVWSTGWTLFPREADGVVHTVRLARLGHGVRRVGPVAVAVWIDLDEVVRWLTVQYPLRQVPTQNILMT